MIEYLYHAVDRATFVLEMGLFTNPATNTSLATLDGDALIPSEGLLIDEIGPVIEYGADGETVVKSTPGHHVNLAIYGQLADMLTAGRPQEGDVFSRTRILDLLNASMSGEMAFEPISAAGVPEGWEGPSGSRVFDPAVVNSRARVWA